MDLRAIVLSLEEFLKDVRRALHRIPEGPFGEEKTSAYVARILREMGLEVMTDIGATGVVGLLQGQGSGPTVMVRADMDGLPLEEETGLPFSSEHPGFMHACGHDANMAMAIGVAATLKQVARGLPGRLKVVFQPAEEIASGAFRMIEEGVLEEPRVDWALGCHLWPGIPKGTIGVRSGPLMAAMDRFDIEIIGRGGHGAMPHLCVDALDVGVQVVNGLQRIVSRQMNPIQPAVVTVGSFVAGTAFNVISERAKLSGTTRTFNREIWDSWHQRIEKVVSGICSSMGARYEMSYKKGCPPLINHPVAAQVVKNAAQMAVGKDRVLEPEPTTTGEDMAWYLEKVPGCYFFVGIGEDGRAPLHNPRFTFDEGVLVSGVETMVRACLALFQNK